MAKIARSIKTDKATWEALKKLAKADGRSVSNYVDRVLTEHTGDKAKA